MIATCSCCSSWLIVSRLFAFLSAFSLFLLLTSSTETLLSAKPLAKAMHFMHLEGRSELAISCIVAMDSCCVVL